MNYEEELEAAATEIALHFDAAQNNPNLKLEAFAEKHGVSEMEAMMRAREIYQKNKSAKTQDEGGVTK